MQNVIKSLLNYSQDELDSQGTWGNYEFDLQIIFELKLSQYFVLWMQSWVDKVFVNFFQGSNQIQDQTRPILRPPPMPPSFGATPPSSQRGNDEKDSNYTVDEGLNCVLCS